MVAQSLARRMAELEQKVGAAKAWHVVIQRCDQTEEEAIAAYEAEKGPMGVDDGRLLFVVIRKPEPTRVAA